MSTSATLALVEPFDDYVCRRARSALVLARGEAVTAAVALLRGCRYAMGRFAGLRWWMRADGCPVAVEDEGGGDPVAATADALDGVSAVTAAGTTRDMVTLARESVLTRPPREWDALERRLFAHAEPFPLILGPLTPVSAADPDDVETAPPGRARLLALVDADLAAAVLESTADLRARWQSSRAFRFGVIAATAAAVVAVAAAVLPVPGGEATTDAMTAEAVSPVPSHRPLPPVSASASPPGADSEHSVPPNDIAGAARALFSDIEQCAGDDVCSASYREDSYPVGDPLIAGASSSDIALIDDFGGVAVVRVSSDDENQYVTLVRQEDRWLVRTARTGADQPS